MWFPVAVWWFRLRTAISMFTLILLFIVSFRSVEECIFSVDEFALTKNCFCKACWHVWIIFASENFCEMGREFFQDMLNCGISVVCPVRSMVNHDQFQTKDHSRDMLRVCYGCVQASTVIYGFLRSLAVDCRRNKLFQHVENRAMEKRRRQKRGGWFLNITVMSTDPGRLSHG